jgi:hypothetical protein
MGLPLGLPFRGYVVLVAFLVSPFFCSASGFVSDDLSERLYFSLVSYILFLVLCTRVLLGLLVSGYVVRVTFHLPHFLCSS